MKFSQHQQTVMKTYVKLMRAANSVTTKMHRYLTDYRLTLSQFGVLEALYSLGPMHQKLIGKKILKTGGNITLVIDNLTKRKLVKRKQDPDDRRYIIVQLTKEGRNLMDTLFPIHARQAEAAFASLTIEEINELGWLLKQLGTSN